MALRDVPRDIGESVVTTYNALRGDDIDIENNTTGNDVEFGRRKALATLGGLAVGSAAAGDRLDVNSRAYSAGSTVKGYIPSMPEVDINVRIGDSSRGEGNDTETPTETPTENETDPTTPESRWTESYSGRDFSGDLIGMGQGQANATADLFETAYESSKSIDDVTLMDWTDVEKDHMIREFQAYEGPAMKVNNLAAPVYDGTPDADAVEGLGYSEDFVEDTLEPLDNDGELTRVGQEYVDEVLDL